MKKHSIQKLIISLILMAGSAVVLISSGCGIKTPPVPPHAEVPKPVNDLTQKIDGNTLTLSWTIPDLEKSEQYAGFMVYRAVNALTSTVCDDCPKVFEKAGDVAMTTNDTGREPAKAYFQETLKQGYRYSYMVKSVTEKGIHSPDSNIVTVEF